MFLLVFSNFSLNAAKKTALKRNLLAAEHALNVCLKLAFFLVMVLVSKLGLKLEEH